MTGQGIVEFPVQRVQPEATLSQRDALAVEEPLEIRLVYAEAREMHRKSVAVTMRTPGHDADLALGFLFAEGILQSNADVVDVRPCDASTEEGHSGNVLNVHLKTSVPVDVARLERHFYTNSSCGVCGKKSIEALEVAGCPVLPAARPVVDADVIRQLPETLRTAQAVFDQTGGLHAAALFDASGQLLKVREDVGRHNALDKLVGACLQEGLLPLHDHVLLVSGRASFELVQKALMAGLPMLAAVSAPSSLAVELAQSYGMTLLGFVRNHRFNVYCEAERIRDCAAPAQANLSREAAH